MQLILLSGGSGKRLWPLSNNIRSKQFLSLFKRNDGKMESMLQRVVRQVMEEHLTDNITIATNDSQSEIITTQLGNNISIVTEPERRDTFPAIALATSRTELQSPIFIDGLEDVVVSANKDGVFICSKKYSEDIKQYIETIH